MIGRAAASSAVTVNGFSTYRKGEYFHKELSVANETAAVYEQVDLYLDGVKQDDQSGNVFVPQKPESPTYDADGNLTKDGRWDYTWNAENRLVKMKSHLDNSFPQWTIEFEYDWRGRRISKKVLDSSGATQSHIKFIYDGWNLVAELDATNSDATIRTYAWGIDLSGSEQGAGGVGGLLMVNHEDPQGAHGMHYVAHDGNGNVMALYDAGDGSIAGSYEYGPFGGTIRVSGTMGGDNPFRFSTKYTDDTSGLVYYGFRYYDPETGRWLNRDIIGEQVVHYRWAIENGYSFENEGYGKAQNHPVQHPDFWKGGEPYTSPVGEFEPNPYGIYDLAGNVWEFCWDRYDSDYYRNAPNENPRGPIGVFSEASAAEKDGRRLFALSAKWWGITTIVTGILGVGVYWLVHESTLRREDPER